MELITTTTVKKMAPKKGFIAPYIRFQWGYDKSIIGKPVTIYKADKGFFIQLETNEFTPSDKAVNGNLSSVDEFKPNESTNETHKTAHVIEQLRCYSVVRPIMRASHARDWGSNPHSSIFHSWSDSPLSSRF
jgi:hypothetical protein